MLNANIMAITLSQIYERFLKNIKLKSPSYNPYRQGKTTITNASLGSSISGFVSSNPTGDTYEKLSTMVDNHLDSLRSVYATNPSIRPSKWSGYDPEFERLKEQYDKNTIVSDSIKNIANTLDKVIDKLPKIIDPYCPIHNIIKTCPICGHDDCGCGYFDAITKNKDKLPEPPRYVDTLDKNQIKDMVNETFENLKKNPPKPKDNDETLPSDNSNLPNTSPSDNNVPTSSGLPPKLPSISSTAGNPPSYSPQILLDLFSKCIDANLQLAMPTPTQNVSIRIAAGTLWLSETSNPLLKAIDIASKIMLYWTICILPIGTPMAGQIVAVIPTNTAALIMPMVLDLLTLQGKAGDDYLPLCEIIVDYSKKVMYTVNEVTPAGVPVVFPVQLT